LKDQYRDIEFEPKAPDDVKRFVTLTQAIDFVAACLEQDDVSALASEIETMQARLAYDPGYLGYFIPAIFSQLKDLHEKKDLRSAVIPDDASEYELRFSDFTLIGMHVRFARHPDGWLIHDMYLTRA